MFKFTTEEHFEGEIHIAVPNLICILLSTFKFTIEEHFDSDWPLIKAKFT